MQTTTSIQPPSTDETGDDLARHMATLTSTERADLVWAEKAIDLAVLLHQARERRGLSQAEAARRAGLHPRLVSRLERPQPDISLSLVNRYLTALGYSVEIGIVDPLANGSTTRTVASGS